MLDDLGPALVTFSPWVLKNLSEPRHASGTWLYQTVYIHLAQICSLHALILSQPFYRCKPLESGRFRFFSYIGVSHPRASVSFLSQCTIFQSIRSFLLRLINCLNSWFCFKQSELGLNCLVQINFNWLVERFHKLRVTKNIALCNCTVGVEKLCRLLN